MKKYCIVENGLLEQHAGSKARRDVADTLIRLGWEACPVHPIKVRVNVSYPERIRMALVFWKDWRRVEKTLQRGDELLIQYPLDMYPKVSMLALRQIQKLKQKNVRIGMLIHDLDSLRNQNPEERAWYQGAEEKFLSQADYIISHNEKMTAYLRSCKMTQPIYSLGLFDYRIDSDVLTGDKKDAAKGIVIAGNLSPEKAGYVYQLGDVNVHFRLYGPNVQKEKLGENMDYKGSFPPDKLPQILEGRFGLVWDGDSLDGCGGEFGEYVKYNNPHKASLYLACGLPVIVWKEAAVADFVKKYQAGIAVDSLKEIPEKMANMTEEQYQLLRANVSEIAEKLRNGEMLKETMEKVGR